MYASKNPIPVIIQDEEVVSNKKTSNNDSDSSNDEKYKGQSPIERLAKTIKKFSIEANNVWQERSSFKIRE